MNHKELSKLITDVEEWRLQHLDGNLDVLDTPVQQGGDDWSHLSWNCSNVNLIDRILSTLRHSQFAPGITAGLEYENDAENGTYSFPVKGGEISVRLSLQGLNSPRIDGASDLRSATIQTIVNFHPYSGTSRDTGDYIELAWSHIGEDSEWDSDWVGEMPDLPSLFKFITKGERQKEYKVSWSKSYTHTGETTIVADSLQEAEERAKKDIGDYEGTAQHNPEFNTTEVHEVQN